MTNKPPSPPLPRSFWRPFLAWRSVGYPSELPDQRRHPRSGRGETPDIQCSDSGRVVNDDVRLGWDDLPKTRLTQPSLPKQLPSPR